MKKQVLAIAGIVVAALGAVALRVVLEGRSALAEGDAAMAAKQKTVAIAAWESAARWYLPFAPHVDNAYARLLAVARGDAEHALAAWRAIRRAATATRAAWQPRADELAAANAAIATLSAAHPEGAPAAGQNTLEKAAFHAARLADDGRPSRGAAALAVLGILSWLAGIGTIVVRGIDAAGRLVRRPAVVGATLTAIGLVGWAVGLYNA